MGILRNKHSHGIDGPFIDEFPIKTSIHKGFSMAMLRSASGSELRCQHVVSVCCMQAELDLQCYGGQTSSPEGHLRQGTTSQPVSYLQPTKIRGMAQENPKNILSITIHHYYPSLLSITIHHLLSFPQQPTISSCLGDTAAAPFPRCPGETLKPKLQNQIIGSWS